MRRVSPAALLLLAGCLSDLGIDLDPEPGRSEPDDRGGAASFGVATGGGGTAGGGAVTLPSACGEPLVDTCERIVDEEAVARCSGSAALANGIGYPTIAQALAASSQVVVCPGTWPGPVNVPGSGLLVAADPTPGATVIDGNGSTTGLVLGSGATVNGLTVRNGRTGIRANGSATLECVTVEDNRRSGVVADASLTVLSSTFARNRAGYEGGAISAESVRIEGSVFLDNESGYEGGAISAYGPVDISGSAFEGNHARYTGGALAAPDTGGAVVTLRDSSFTCNTSGYEGGAVEIGSWGHDEVDIDGCRFVENDARYEGGALGFGSWGSFDAHIQASSFVGNDGGYGAGAIQLGGWLEDGGHLTLSGVVLTDNHSDQEGSALSVSSVAPSLKVSGTDLAVLRNTGGVGALSLEKSSFDCTACDFGTGADDNSPADAPGIAKLPSTFSL